jgi:hypothetical protein
MRFHDGYIRTTRKPINFENVGSQYWREINLSASQSRQNLSGKPDFDFMNMGLLFPQNDVSEVVFFNYQFNSDWVIGSTIFPRLYFIQSNVLTPNFIMAYKWYDNDDATAYAGSFTNLVASTFEHTYTSGNLPQIATFPSISGSGITKMYSFIEIALLRDDNNAIGDVLEKGLSLRAQYNGLGSLLPDLKG